MNSSPISSLCILYVSCTSCDAKIDEGNRRKLNSFGSTGMSTSLSSSKVGVGGEVEAETEVLAQGEMYYRQRMML